MQMVCGCVLSFTFAAIIGSLHVGILYLFGLPILPFIGGLVLIWTSRSSAQIKSVATLSSLLIIPVSFFVSFQLSKAEAETFLIPLNYRGEFVVFFDEECGTLEELDKGRRIYRIPDTGVLITGFKKTEGYLDQQFYRVGNDLETVKIPFFLFQNIETERKHIAFQDSKRAEDLTDKTVGIFWAYGSETYRISQKSSAFIIDDFKRYSRSEKDRFAESKEFVDTAAKLLRDCRKTTETQPK